MSFQLSPGLDNSKVFLVNRSELGRRLDPIFYYSDLNKFISGKYESNKIGSVAIKIISGIGAGKQDQSDKVNGFVQIRPTNITSDGLLKYDKNVFLPRNSKFEKISVGDVLFNNTNSQELVGKTSILKENKELFFSNHITKITVDKAKIAPEYLAITLNIYQKNGIFYSICTNWNNQSGVGIDLLKSLKIPIPPKAIQSQIVAKMDTAYAAKKQKEAEAQRLLDSIDDYLLGELGIRLPEQGENTIQSRMFTRRLSEVSGGRFDPEYFKSSYKNLEMAISQSPYNERPIREVTAALINGSTPASSEYSDTSTPYPIIKVGSYEGDTIRLEKTGFTKEKRVKFAEKNDIYILSAAHQAEYVGRSLKYLQDAPNENTSFVGELICVRSDQNVCNPVYLYSLLNTNLYKDLLNREKTGQTSHIYPKDIQHIRIPLPPLEKQTEIADYITTIRDQAKALQQQAKADLEQTKKEVESMILGENENIA